MLIEINRHLVRQDKDITYALQILNSLGDNLALFVVGENDKLLGVVTDGDIRRGLLQGVKLAEPVSRIMNKDFKFLQWDTYSLDVLESFRNSSVKILPVVDSDFKIMQLISLEKVRSILPLDAVIMAGGRGERLKPFTDHIPKPMLLIGDKPIIEYSIDRLSTFGINNVFISVRYLADKIQSHFGDGDGKGISISYLKEDEPLGTIGALRLTDKYKHDTVLVINSDILTNIDYEDFYRAYMDSGADMVVATTSYSVNVPYAVLETENGTVKSLKEKPTYTFYSNAGIYIINRKHIDAIPLNTHFNATDLMEHLIKINAKVIPYNIVGYWLDIGKHEDFQKAQEDIKHINF